MQQSHILVGVLLNAELLRKKSIVSAPLTSFGVRGIFISELKSFKKSLFIGLLLLCLFSCGGPAFAANSTPSVGAITPSSGSSAPDVPVTFTTTYIDADGWKNLQLGYLLINTSVSGINGCYVYYNQNTNKLYLRNDSNTLWLGGYAPGSSSIIENSYARLDCSKTAVSGSGAALTVRWNVIFKNAFCGAAPKNTYLYVTDDSGISQGWLKKGTWQISNTAPTITITEPIIGDGHHRP